MSRPSTVRRCGTPPKTLPLTIGIGLRHRDAGCVSCTCWHPARTGPAVARCALDQLNHVNVPYALADSAGANDILDAGREVRGTKGETVKKLASQMVKAKSWSTKNPVWDVRKQMFDTLRVAEAEGAMVASGAYIHRGGAR